MAEKTSDVVQEERVAFLAVDALSESEAVAARPSISRELASCWSARKNWRELHRPPAGRTGPLDGIRTAAVLWVVMLHTFSVIRSVVDQTETAYDGPFYYRWVLNGGFGVDMFFVLSGFLMYQILSKSIAAGTFRPLRFFLDRARRLLPAYMVVMCLFWGLQALGNDPTLPEGCNRYFWANVIFVNNFVPFKNQCMQWSWSIAVEYQFYLVSPVFVYLLVRRPVAAKRVSWIAVAVSTVLNIVLTLLGGDNYMNWVYVKPYTRISPYIFGMLSAHAVLDHGGVQNENVPRWRLRLKLAAALVLFLLPAVAAGEPTPVMIVTILFGRQIISAGLAYVIYYLVTNPDSRAARILSARPAYFMANLSYSIYLWHPPFTVFIGVPLTFVGRPLLVPTNMFGLWVLFLAVTAASVFFSLLLFQFVEKPFMNMRRVFDRCFDRRSHGADDSSNEKIEMIYTK
eukprot:TRINITY_DN2121_c0_g1_i2.p1 TRINITY_DN2121_c0_g1~~TRINITY_DN2121_c0_g1_i2.p1  ORF type:complete len:456 (+),score=112.37 TRINITY_DN2121_c0_g1_i2:128-1495(+)